MVPLGLSGAAGPLCYHRGRPPCALFTDWPTPAAFVGSHVKGGKRKEGITAGRWWVEGWWGPFLVKTVQPLLVGTDSTPLIDYPG